MIIFETLLIRCIYILRSSTRQSMDIIYVGLFLNICLTHGTLYSNKFRRFIAPCGMTHSIYYNVTDNSAISCGSMCNDNVFGTCDRFAYDPKGKTCFLHSTRVSASTFSISPEDTWMTYSKSVKDCYGVGYDFDSETSTCLKYHVVANGVTWKQSRARCKQDGGDLITIQTKAKWDLVTNYVRKCSPEFWIGLKDRTWTTGEQYVNVFGVDDQLNNYDSGFPGDPEVGCGSLRTSEQPLQDESCNIRLRTGFLCEIILL